MSVFDTLFHFSHSTTLVSLGSKPPFADFHVMTSQRTDLPLPIFGKGNGLGVAHGFVVAVIKYEVRQLLQGCARLSYPQYGSPEIMNTNQNSQLTGAAWITTLTEADVKISLAERERYLDNIFIERLWRSLRREAVYLHELTDGFL